MMGATIATRGDNLEITFGAPWDEAAYERFIQSKHLPEYNLSYDWERDTYILKTPSRFAHVFDMDKPTVDHGWDAFAPHLFDYQAFITKIALQCKRYAVWADTGLGKTAIFLEWARQINYRVHGKILLIVPLNIIDQTMDEASKFYSEYPIEKIKSREMLKLWAADGAADIGIVNPEKFIPRNGEKETVSEMQHLVGVVLDEASILKAGGGKIKWALIKSCRGIEYKLTATATPAPNDTMEYASQGSFLEKLRNEGEILWTFFRRDKTGAWHVKSHARQAFYRFLSGWSVYLRSPKNYGFDDNLKGLPDPIIKEYKIEPTEEQRKIIQRIPDQSGQLAMFGNSADTKLGITQRIAQSQIAKGFKYINKSGKARRIHSEKPIFVSDLIKKDVADGLQVLVWTVFDEESAIISELLDVEHVVLTGKVPKAKRVGMINRFRRGDVPVMISKASILGFGLNFQNCGSMIFSGFNDSFEQFYQAVRRAYRYGQTKSVRVHIPYIPELEGIVWNNVRDKESKFIHDISVQEANYYEAMKEEIGRFVNAG